MAARCRSDLTHCMTNPASPFDHPEIYDGLFDGLPRLLRGLLALPGPTQRTALALAVRWAQSRAERRDWRARMHTLRQDRERHREQEEQGQPLGRAHMPTLCATGSATCAGAPCAALRAMWNSTAT